MGVVANNVSTLAGVRALVGLVCIGKRMQNKRKKKNKTEETKAEKRERNIRNERKTMQQERIQKTEKNPNTNYIKPHVAVEVINWLMFWFKAKKVSSSATRFLLTGVAQLVRGRKWRWYALMEFEGMVFVRKVWGNTPLWGAMKVKKMVWLFMFIWEEHSFHVKGGCFPWLMWWLFQLNIS